MFPVISPDGRYIAYSSDESGRPEVYVRPFPEGEGRWPVSVNGGEAPQWNRSGTELFYAKGDTLMAVSVSTKGEFRPGIPKSLFTVSSVALGMLAGFGNRYYDVSPDGQRFVVVRDVGEATQQTTIAIVQNWYAEIKDRE